MDFLKNTSNKIKKKWKKFKTTASRKTKLKAARHLLKNAPPKVRQQVTRNLGKIPRYKKPHKDLFELLALSEELEKDESLRECECLDEADKQLQNLEGKESKFLDPRFHKIAKIWMLRVGRRLEDKECEREEAEELREKMMDLCQPYLEEE